MKKFYVFFLSMICGLAFAQAQCTLTVNSNPSSPICSGAAVTINVTGANTYLWTPGGMTGNSVTVYPTGTTTYTVVGTDLSSNTCSAAVVVNVHPLPAAPLIGTITQPSCEVATGCVVLHGLPATGVWTVSVTPSGDMYTGVGASTTICELDTGSYTITVINSIGCVSLPSSAVVILPQTNIFAFNVSPLNASVPVGQCATFHIPEVGTYIWSPAFGLNTTNGPAVTACPTTTTTYTVMGANQSGCTGSTIFTVHVTGTHIEDVSGSTSCHLPYLAILNITDDFVQHNDTILYNLNYGDGMDTTFTMIYQNDTAPMAAITHAYTAMGTYSPWAILQHTDGLADTIHTQNLIVASDTCGDISGTVFFDLNANCTPDVGEFRLSNALIKLFNPGHTLLQAQFTDASGFYYFNAPNGNYIMEIDSLISMYYGLVCPAGGAYTITSVPAVGKHFGLNCMAGFDLLGDITAHCIRPGVNVTMGITIGNPLCTSTNAIAQIILDYRTSYSGATPTPSNISGDTISWVVNHLAITDTAYQTIYVNVHVSPTAVIGDSVLFNLTMNPISGDVNPLNNTLIRKLPIVGSWDPNGKEVSPAGDITKNTDLTYTIHFQNTGSAEAYNIYILDTLDANLDLGTLKMIAASHPYSVEILNSNQDNILKFFFPNIMLPDSGSNQMLSNGFVSYKIRPLSNCAEGTIITNLADIYFDYNPAVPTNMVQNQISTSIGVKEETISSTRDRVVPNPVNQQATLTYAVPEQGKTVIKLFDITGKETLSLLNQDLNQGEHHLTFDCKDLKSGIYFIRICTSRSSSVVKLVKL